MTDLKLGRSKHSPWDAKRLSILDAIPAKLPSPPTRTSRSTKLPASKIDILGNDWNLRFRHGKNDTMNALMADGHVTSFHVTTNGLRQNPPVAGDLFMLNINLDNPN